MPVRYKIVTDAPEGLFIMARETDDGIGVVWEEWRSDDRNWRRSEWACDAFHGFDDYAVKNVRDIYEAEALLLLAERDD